MVAEANQILQIPLTNVLDEDTISWQGTRDGIYTVKSGYNAQIEWDTTEASQAQTSNYHKDELFWKNLWNIKVPPKQIHLLWRMWHNVIPVKANLINRGIICDSICPKCNKGPETINHLFLNCDWAKLVWFYSPLTIRTDNTQTLNYRKWFHYMINNTSKENMQTISAIIYGMWNERNNKVFREKDTPVNETVDRAMQNLHEYHHHTIKARLPPTHSVPPSVAGDNISWSPPPATTLKLNVDAHLTGDGHWAFGWVVRQSDGRCVGAVTKVLKGTDDATEAEAMGLLEAIIWAKSQQYDKVIFETDAEVIVTAIRNKAFPRTNWGQIAKRCSRVLSFNDDYTTSWVRRDKNYAAHTLARWAVVEPNKHWTNSFPLCILNHVQKDMGNVT
ncbi:Ribonuclease H superfamily protein [Trifolium repens]|nr:Ribonuclease H superfamily protein [Trifolium repens]